MAGCVIPHVLATLVWDSLSCLALLFHIRFRLYEASSSAVVYSASFRFALFGLGIVVT